jgi:protein associated with RNAse G/E
LSKVSSEPTTYATEKWGGHPHYGGLVYHLGDDAHGSWLWGPAGRTISRGTDTVFVAEQSALTVIVPGAWWAPTWWVGHPSVALYVNINTPASWDADRVSSVDLDLDVVRFIDGRVEIVDEDEFELHQRQYGYPADLVVAARRAADTAFDLVSRNEPPFDGHAADGWVVRAQALTLETGR